MIDTIELFAGVGGFRVGLEKKSNNGQFNIQIKTSEKEELNMVIRNVVGQTVYSDKVSVINSLNKSLDLSHLKKGIYTISLEKNSSVLTTKKITIQ